MTFNEIPVRTTVRCFSNIKPTHDMNKDKRLISVRMTGRMHGYCHRKRSLDHNNLIPAERSVCDVHHNPLETVNQPSTQFCNINTRSSVTNVV